MSATPAAPSCPLSPLRLVMDPTPTGAPNGRAVRVTARQTIVSLDARGAIELAIAPGKATFTLTDAGCLTFDGKLVAEMLPGGRVISVTGETIATLRGAVLALRHSTITFDASGALTQDPDPGLPPERVVGFDANAGCAAAMLIVALGESASGASMAVVDGVAKHPPPAPAQPESRCGDIPR